MPFYTYILHSKSLDRYYTGSTLNVERRLREHLWEHSGYTSKAKDWEVMFTKEFQTKIEALKLEKQIKGWKSRKMLEKLIGKDK